MTYDYFDRARSNLSDSILKYSLAVSPRNSKISELLRLFRKDKGSKISEFFEMSATTNLGDFWSCGPFLWSGLPRDLSLFLVAYAIDQ